MRISKKHTVDALQILQDLVLFKRNIIERTIFWDDVAGVLASEGLLAAIEVFAASAFFCILHP